MKNVSLPIRLKRKFAVSRKQGVVQTALATALISIAVLSGFSPFFALPAYSQEFKVVIAKFQDRTGVLVRKESEVQGGVAAGAVAGSNAIGGAASGQASASSTESGKGDLGSQAADIFTSELVKTGRFLVLDGQMFAHLLDSAQYKGDMVAVAKAMGAHYLLTGAVTQAGVSESGGSVLGFGGKSTQGRATLSVTLTNVETGQIVVADNAEGTKSEGGAVLFGGQVGGKEDLGLLLSSALDDAVKNLVPKITQAVGDLTDYPIECDVAVSGGQIFLSKGKNDGVTKGDIFKIVGIGKTISFGSKKIQEKVDKGTVTVIDVHEEYAIASGDTIGLAEGDKAFKIVKKDSSQQ